MKITISYGRKLEQNIKDEIVEFLYGGGCQMKLECEFIRL